MEPAAVGTAAAAVYAAVVMVYEVLGTHHGLVRADVLIAAVSAVWGLWTRARVTPLARPRDAAGRPLVPDWPPVKPAPKASPAGLGDEPTS